MALRALSTNVLRRLATALVVAALCWPLVRAEDGLPLSTYPMYSSPRSDVLSIVTVHGVTATGLETLSTPEIAETRDPLIAQSFLNDAVASNALDIVCREIASRVGGEFSSIEIALEQRNTVEHVRGRDSLIQRDELQRCAVPR